MIRSTIVAVLVLAAPARAQDEGARHADATLSPYAGAEQRGIKSLSAEDVEELERGGGWGLALAAELNGVPGPTHLLELRAELELEASQVTRIRALRDDMRRGAIATGRHFIAAERALSEAFASNVPTEDELRRLTRAAGLARAALREVHLSAHLKTPSMLTAEQMLKYAELRGYAPADGATEKRRHAVGAHRHRHH